MRGFEIANKCLTKLFADAPLVELLGGNHIYRSRTRKNIKVPGVYYTIVNEQLGENEVEIVIQWDVWAEKTSQQVQIEQKLYELMHSDLPLDYSGLLMWSEYSGRHDLTDGEEEAQLHSALEFRYSTAREDR